MTLTLSETFFYLLKIYIIHKNIYLYIYMNWQSL
jgi:hypothetical protein